MAADIPRHVAGGCAVSHTGPLERGCGDPLGAGRTTTRQGWATGADVSERWTWELCPRCDERAALVWTNNEVVEADCYSSATFSRASSKVSR